METVFPNPARLLRPNPKKNMKIYQYIIYGTLCRSWLYVPYSLCGLRIDSNTITTGNPMTKLTLSVRDVGFGLRAACGNRVSHKNMNPSLTWPFSLFISVAITNLFRDHTPVVLLRRKRTMKCRVVSKNIWVILHGRRNHIIEIKFSCGNFSYHCRSWQL
jgi:hypothetical protein